MTERLRGVDLPRPEPAADKGPLDTRFYDLVEARVRRVFVDNPVYASLFGIHTEDHANARRLAAGLAELDGVRSPGGIAQPDAYGDRLDPTRIATNFVLFRVDRDRATVLAALEARGVLLVPYAHGQIRAVTHDGITADDIDAVIAAVAEVLRDTAPSPAGEPATSAA